MKRKLNEDTQEEVEITSDKRRAGIPEYVTSVGSYLLLHLHATSHHDVELTCFVEGLMLRPA